MNVEIHSCPICNSDQIKSFANFDKVFQFVHDHYHSFSMKKNICSKCGHIFLHSCEDFLLDEHYTSTRNADDNLIYSDTDESNEEFDSLVDWFSSITDIDADKVNILDIGAGKCDLLSSFNKKFNDAQLYGIDYSPRSKVYGKAKGIDNIVVGDFYEESHNGVLFDIVTATGVLEHQLDLMKFINKIKMLAKDGAYMLIEVPSSISILTKRPDLNSRCIHDIYNNEHFHHFNLENLIELFRSNGLEIVGSQERTRGIWEVIDIVVRLHDKKYKNTIELNKNLDNSTLIKEFNIRKTSDQIKIQKLIRGSSRVGVYGAGWHTTIVLPSYYEFKFDNVVAIFDQDIRKHGKKIYGVEIMQPKPDLLCNLDVIIISSINLEDDILTYLISSGVDKNKIISLYD
jgi:2-polyprenyl-3-methyl-5-hydroxy-6-metoxy-1,4-benzoquinol methylase